MGRSQPVGAAWREQRLGQEIMGLGYPEETGLQESHATSTDSKGLHHGTGTAVPCLPGPSGQAVLAGARTGR